MRLDVKPEGAGASADLDSRLQVARQVVDECDCEWRGPSKDLNDVPVNDDTKCSRAQERASDRNGVLEAARHDM